MTSKDQLDETIRAYNHHERGQFMRETGTTWLGLGGPTYQLGDVRAKALFIDTQGRHWADGALVAESISFLACDSPRLIEAYSQALCGPDVESFDLMVHTDTRGKWNALMSPVGAIADALGYPPPMRMPEGDWARTWWDSPSRSDLQEIAWIANGGRPLNSYRTGGEL